MVVVGQSMGGALALRYAIAHPERTLAVAFTNAMSAFQEREAWARRSRAAAAEAVVGVALRKAFGQGLIGKIARALG